jgi:hypothetical protein
MVGSRKLIPAKQFFFVGFNDSKIIKLVIFLVNNCNEWDN